MMHSARLLSSRLSSLIVPTCLAISLFHNVLAGNAPFTPCTGSDKPIMSKNVKIDVSDCQSTDRCSLKIGSSYNFTVNFVPEVSLQSRNGIERYITAKFPAVEGDKPIELPYGAPEKANNNTINSQTGKSIFDSDNKVSSGVNYSHSSIFPVPAIAPKTNLTVRFLLREKIPGRRLPSWKTHPGQLLTCIEIPVELID